MTAKEVRDFMEPLLPALKLLDISYGMIEGLDDFTLWIEGSGDETFGTPGFGIELKRASQLKDKDALANHVNLTIRRIIGRTGIPTQFPHETNI